MRRRVDELAETQHWVHHVGDLDSGEVLTTQLDRPVMPLSRAERLSRLGHVFDDTSIFWDPGTGSPPGRPIRPCPRPPLCFLQALAARSSVSSAIRPPTTRSWVAAAGRHRPPSGRAARLLW